jgi:hypothetical protein
MITFDPDAQFLILLGALALPCLAALVQLGLLAFPRRSPAPLTYEQLTEAINAALDAHDAQVRAMLAEARKPAWEEGTAAEKAVIPPPHGPAELPPVPAPNGHDPLLDDAGALRAALAAEPVAQSVPSIAADAGTAVRPPPAAKSPPADGVERRRLALEKANQERAAAAAVQRDELKDRVVEAFRTRGEQTTTEAVAEEVGHSAKLVKRVLRDNKTTFVEHDGKWGLREWLTRAP